MKRRARWVRNRSGRALGAGGIALLVLSALACASAPTGPDQVWRGAEARALDLESFDTIVQTVQRRHWDPDHVARAWNGAPEQMRARVAEARNRSEARQVFRELLELLGQSHFGVLSGDEYSRLSRLAGGGIDGDSGLDLRLVEGRPLITRVRSGSPAEEAGIGLGWEVIAIRGEPLEPLLGELVGDETSADAAVESAYSTAMALRYCLLGAEGEALSLGLRRPDGEAVDLELELAPRDGAPYSFGPLAEDRLVLEVETLPSGVGRIAFNAFMAPGVLMPGYGDAIRSFGDAPGVVLDLRGNPGGIGGMAMGMAGWLVRGDDGYLGTMVTRDGELKFIVPPRARPFLGPVAVLVDELSASTTEIFAGGLQDLGRARIFGSRTAGAALPSEITTLPNGDVFQHATAGYRSRSGRILEGDGVVPDVSVPRTREDLQAGRDAALETAVRWILNQSEITSQGEPDA